MNEWEDYSSALDRAAKVIDDAELVVLACHVNPDGDALGSMLALHLALLAAGRRSVASFPAPFVVAPHYRELPGLDRLVPPSEVPEAPDVMVTFDCGAMNRLAGLQPTAERAGELIVLDHHISNERYGTVNVIDSDAAATGVVVHRLIGRLGLPLTDGSAIALYAALVCDTGRFQYETTTPEVFALAGELVGYDVPVARLSRTLFEEHRFAYLQLLAEALAAAELVREQRFVWTAVTQEMLARHGVALEEIEGLIDVVRRTAEADIACVLKEEADGSVKVSLRSVGDSDVRLVASAYGGGGHRFAAGFTSTVGIAETVDRIRAAL
ncbi:MAG: bifunctional oligoribonuclease/PAP phosphatase NrnA [Actinobacteria bacterium]|nr:bifunctional oligoribonuclease/PAP phosphatase NrnA [Actinomycetota bacterium]